MIKYSPFFLIFLIVVFSCKDKVTRFSGFTQKEMEFLLASTDAKVWERISREEDGEEIFLEDCEAESYLIFLQDEVGDPKPLLYAYNPTVCDSLDFCDLHPDFCISDTTLCGENPDFCEDLQDGILFIGSWYVKEPFIENSRADTLIFEINEKSESIQVTSITSDYATFLYRNRTGPSGGSVIENYQFVPSDTE